MGGGWDGSGRGGGRWWGPGCGGGWWWVAVADVVVGGSGRVRPRGGWVGGWGRHKARPGAAGVGEGCPRTVGARRLVVVERREAGSKGRGPRLGDGGGWGLGCGQAHARGKGGGELGAAGFGSSGPQLKML